jgi:hypothetical protein
VRGDVKLLYGRGKTVTRVRERGPAKKTVEGPCEMLEANVKHKSNAQKVR